VDISIQPWFVWLERQPWALPWLGRIFRIGFRLGVLLHSFQKVNMLKIGVVGDLSLQDPARLEKAMAAAWAASDIVVNVGDMHPAYPVILSYAAKGKFVYAIPGNHDAEWDSKLGWARQWRHDLPLVTLIGLDNSQDSFSPADWALLDKLPATGPTFIFVHKPLSNVVLPDGSASTHNMGEGSPNADAVKMAAFIQSKCDILLVHGHYHGWAFMRTLYADCLVEGRGGAAPEIGWTQILVTPDGFTIHRFDLP
jgi:predicted phosphodiesterase